MRGAWGRVAVAVTASAAALTSCTLPGQVSGPVELTTTFDDVGDLVSGHSVQVADVRVGSVTGIRLLDDYRAEVTMSIKDGLDLPASTQAVLRTTSLLGEKFIELRPPEGEQAGDGDVLEDGDVIEDSEAAPELEFVAEQAVQLLGQVAASDLGTIIETGALAFGGREAELTTLVEDLATVTGALADQTGDIVRIIDGLDQASQTLAAGAPRLDDLLVNLSGTIDVLADNRELTIDTIEDLTRLAAAQNEQVFEPYADEITQQIEQVDAVLALVAERRGEVATLVDWLETFALNVQRGIPDTLGGQPNDFALIYLWLTLGPLDPLEGR